MPTYKNIHRHSANSEDLKPFRPMDRMADYIWENRKPFALIIAAGFLALIAWTGFQFYQEGLEEKARVLLDKGQFEDVVSHYSNSSAATMARLKLGKKALDAKDYDQAVRWYEPVGNNAKAPALFRVAALQNEALAYLKKGDTLQAAAALNRAAHDPKNESADYTQLLLANVYEASGDGQKAKETYKALSEGAKEAAVKQEAKERLSWLEPIESKPAPEKNPEKKKEKSQGKSKENPQPAKDKIKH